MKEFETIRLSYGESDEFSFVFDKDTTLYGAWHTSCWDWQMVERNSNLTRSCMAHAAACGRSEVDEICFHNYSMLHEQLLEVVEPFSSWR